MIFFTILVFSYPKPTTNSQEITNVDGGWLVFRWDWGLL